MHAGRLFSNRLCEADICRVEAFFAFDTESAYRRVDSQVEHMKNAEKKSRLPP